MAELLLIVASLCFIASCSKDDSVATEGNESVSSDDAIVVTGECVCVGPVSADIYMYVNTKYSLFESEFSSNYAKLQYSDDRLIENGSEQIPISFQLTDRTITFFDPDVPNRLVVHLNCLKPNTTYYYRAYVRIGNAYRYGEVRQFKTPVLNLPEHSPVNLGLSVKWASTNIGAANLAGKGNTYTQITAFQLQTDGLRLPSAANFQELLDKCICASAIYNGVRGFMATGPSGKSVFFPANTATFIGESETGILPIEASEPFLGTYWSSDESQAFIFHGTYSDDASIITSDPRWSRCIRLVCN